MDKPLGPKEQLLQAVWSSTHVGEAVLKVSLQQIRAALGDNAKMPRFIETVRGRGYRFIAPVTTSPQAASGSKFQVPSFKPKPVPSPQPLTPNLVGREAELEQLHEWLAKAMNGQRQIIFVTGEPRIGKTTLVDAFVARLAADSRIWIARGQCIEHYGAGEPYQPVLEALERLCREPGHDDLLLLLRQHAPLWLVQMPALLSPEEREALQRELRSTTQERMLREMTALLETLTAETPLVLWLEDLHWSDPSTLHLLAALARQRQAARLLLIGTYRPVEVLANGHPLRAVQQELQGHRLCTELPLAWLSEAAVKEYLTVRFGDEPVYSAPSSLTMEAYPERSRRGRERELPQAQLQHTPPHPVPLSQGERGPISARHTTYPQLGPLPLQELARVLHRRTEGNPLSLVTVADDLVAQGVIGQVDGYWTSQGGLDAITASVPKSLRQLIEKQIERLSPEDQQVLAAASVVGAEFSAAAVAAALETDTEQVEDCCDELVRQHLFLQAHGQGVVPERRRTARYGFRHTLSREVVYAQVTKGRRARLHRRIGEWAEGAYGERAQEIAAELAVHFTQGRDPRRAVQYHGQAAEKAIQRHAGQEAVAHLTSALALLKTLPDTSERAQHELRLQFTLRVQLGRLKGEE